MTFCEWTKTSFWGRCTVGGGEDVEEEEEEKKDL